MAIGPQLVGTVFDGTQEAFTIDLPAGVTVDGFSAVSVWCDIANVSFGDGTFAPPAPLVGDLNLDGAVDFLDIVPFIVILTGGEFQAEADFDQDGAVTFLDIPPFIAILSDQ